MICNKEAKTVSLLSLVDFANATVNTPPLLDGVGHFLGHQFTYHS